MFKLTVFELEKPAGEEDNEANVVSEDTTRLESSVLELVALALPTLGGTHGKWLEISVE